MKASSPEMFNTTLTSVGSLYRADTDRQMPGERDALPLCLCGKHKKEVARQRVTYFDEINSALFQIAYSFFTSLSLLTERNNGN